MAEKPIYITTEVLNYVAHMPAGDDLVLIVLKGHLLIEQQLEEILETIVAHGKMLEDVQIPFNTKARLAQAMCWGQHENSMWQFIFALNSLRNDFAHSLGSEKTDKKLQATLSAYEGTLDAAEKSEFALRSTAERLKHAIILTIGFLASYAADAQAYRYHVDDIYPELASKPRE